METVVNHLRFVFSANKNREISSVLVRWDFNFQSSEKIELRNILELKPLNDHQYINDLIFVGKPGERRSFQFEANYHNCPSRQFPVECFTLFNGSTSPLEICETDDDDDATSSLDSSQQFTLRFKINYFTYFGQNLYIVGSTRKLGFWDPHKAFALSHCGSVGPSSVGTNQLFSDRRYN